MNTISGISPHVFPPHPALSLPYPPQLPPVCVMLLSLNPCVLVVQHPPMSENMQCLVFCSCVSLLRMMVSGFIQVPAKDTNSSFLWLCSISWWINATFCLSSLSLIGIWVGSRSLLLYTVLQWTYMCICLYNRMINSPVGVYPVMGLLGQMEVLFLGPWEVATPSSTMVELIYTPTNHVKVFLFLHILSSIYCLQII